MCISEDFATRTEAQSLRDDAFLSATRERFVEPLVSELRAAIPNYEHLGWYERFGALMQMNEEHAPKGAALLLDFGTVASGVTEDGVEVAYANKPARGLVFSGTSSGYGIEERDGLKIYTPLLAEDGLGVGPFTFRVDETILSDTALPLPFRVAALALYVRQNTFSTLADSCRFAAGQVQLENSRRWYLDPIVSGLGELFGWRVLVRDITPTNPLAQHIAGVMRDAAATQRYTRPIADLTPRKERRRTRRQSTEAIVWFVDVYLQENGMHVLRSGEGRKISWKRAYDMFREMFPDMYTHGHKSFSNSYHNAKRSRKER